MFCLTYMNQTHVYVCVCVCWSKTRWEHVTIVKTSLCAMKMWISVSFLYFLGLATNLLGLLYTSNHHFILLKTDFWEKNLSSFQCLRLKGQKLNVWMFGNDDDKRGFMASLLNVNLWSLCCVPPAAKRNRSILVSSWALSHKKKRNSFFIL